MKFFAAKLEEGVKGGNGKPSVGPVYRNLLSEKGFPPMDSDITTAWDVFSKSVEKFPYNKVLGWRRIVDEKVGPYMWKTYKEAYGEVLQIGSAIRALGAEPGCRVGIYGVNCPQWIIAMEMTHEDVYLSFLPLAHILDRMNEEYFFRKGASVGYYHGDLNVLRDDIQELKPTYLAGVPRVFERIHEGIQKALQELNPRRRFIFNALYQHKLSWLNRGYSHSKASPMADFIAFRKVKTVLIMSFFLYFGSFVFGHYITSPLGGFGFPLKIRDKLGGRIRLLVSGGAPLSCEIEEFLRVTCCCFVVQGYGLTETLGGTALGFPDEMCMLGTVGIPAVYNEIRLEEVAEMGYDPLGEIQAGEICIRGTCLFSGYYKNPELTQEVMKNGWFHTGDIGEIHPNRVLKIIDRKKNLIKLSQGEYVALENLENIYGQNSVVQDIWVYGDSFKSMLVAVIVPNPETVNRWAKDLGFTKPFEELCSLSELHDEHIILELKSTAEKNKLRKFEYIKAVTVETKPFDVERDLVTATLKNRRNNLLKYYQVQVDEMYRKLSLKKM
ncbi:long chain acyl-CoA synthetase 1-like isoform X2 [Brassica napus]|uniref:long chain acyl-CoA synthetase 1-like isoform X2 n=1 Tax=Brassica napus TaxID=3708 RepID=UPI0020794941|nr:long chain acyl-CoA synthetase 1-like isoform X2 [Brassica napus]